MAWNGHSEMLIFDKFLWECLNHPQMHPGSTLTLNHPAGHQCEMVNDRVCFTGALFNDGDYIYRIGEYSNEYDCNSWHARWPD
jgi:hypothetical protein